MFKIGDFSRLTQVSVRMLRYYDELGLLKPEEVDRFTGYRFYSARQIKRLNKIISLRDMGFIVSEISSMLDDDLDISKLLNKLEEKKLEVSDTIALESSKLERIDKMLKSIRKGSVIMKYEITLKSVPSYKIVALREVIPAYNMEGMLWEKLGKFAETNRIQCIPPCFAIYHDGEYKESDVDVEVAMGVSELKESNDSFTYRETEAVASMASVLITGKYENITEGYMTLAKWIEDNNYEVAGLARQLTHKGPWNESNPDNYLTEVQMPVVKK